MLPDEALLRPIQSDNGTAKTGDVQSTPSLAFEVHESSASACLLRSLSGSELEIDCSIPDTVGRSTVSQCFDAFLS